MIRVKVTDLKNQLSHYLRLVKRGETIEVVERSVPIAQLTRVEEVPQEKALLSRLVSEGIISPASQPPNDRFLDLPPVPCKGDVVQTLIEDRNDR